MLPAPLADDLNTHNDAYPLARASHAAALATLQNEHKIMERSRQLRVWAEQLAAELRTLGVRTFATETYFFLTDFAPRNAGEVADQLKQENILVKPLLNQQLGPGFLRITTALPQDNRPFIEVLTRLMA